MEPKNRHPLENITNRSSLSLLETLIPFVEYPLKLPLALFIKFNEVKMIINAFRSLENLTRLGLHNASNNPMDMISSLTGVPPEMLQMLMSFSDNKESPFPSDILSGLTGNSPMDFSSVANLFQQNPVHTNPPPQNTGNNMNTGNSNGSENEGGDHIQDLDLTIQNIFAEYDIMQAEQLSKEISPDNSDLPYDLPEE